LGVSIIDGGTWLQAVPPQASFPGGDRVMRRSAGLGDRTRPTPVRRLVRPRVSPPCPQPYLSRVPPSSKRTVTDNADAPGGPAGTGGPGGAMTGHRARAGSARAIITGLSRSSVWRRPPDPAATFPRRKRR